MLFRVALVVQSSFVDCISHTFSLCQVLFGCFTWFSCGFFCRCRMLFYKKKLQVVFDTFGLG